MAKVGEGDARWIVQDRADGTNVNQWHWQERDLATVSHDAIKAAFAGLDLGGADGLSVTVKEVSDIAGDVTVAKRKGKIMCYFDINMTIKYDAKLGEEKGAGKMTIPEVEHDSFDDDFEVNVSSTDSKAASKAAEAHVKKNRAAVRSVIRRYFEQLFADHGVGTNVKAGSAPAPSAPATSAPAPAPKPVAAVPAKTASSSNGKQNLEWKMTWRAPQEEMWAVLTNEGRASAYTRSNAKIDPRPSGTFEYLGGLISGYYVEVGFPDKLTMQWRLSSWPAGVFTSVIIALSREDDGVTRMEFAQAGIPDGELERVKSGWQQNFWEPIKMMFGYQLTYL